MKLRKIHVWDAKMMRVTSISLTKFMHFAAICVKVSIGDSSHEKISFYNITKVNITWKKLYLILLWCKKRKKTALMQHNREISSPKPNQNK